MLTCFISFYIRAVIPLNNNYSCLWFNMTLSTLMCADYYAKISKKLIYTIYSGDIINLIIKRWKYVFCCKKEKYFNKKLKYNLITTNKYNQEKKINSLNNFK